MYQTEEQQAQNTVDHLFRYEAGKMVAVLTRLFGLQNLELAEDIVQDTLLAALETWKYGNMPPNPQAWLYKVAKNKTIDALRSRKRHEKIHSDLGKLLESEYTLTATVNSVFNAPEIEDNQLRMMFACCHSALAEEAQLPLILKTLCGLSVKEIAKAFLTNEENIAKRIYRAKEKIKTENIALEYPAANEINNRLETVLKAIYLLFTEGYSSTKADELIRQELCEEAMRLTLLLLNHPATNLPQVNALMALMCFQASRFDSRTDDNGDIVLLKDQDRQKWNRFLIEQGNYYMNRSATGTLHNYHIEATIAFTYLHPATYAQTDWQKLVELFNMLQQLKPGPAVLLNRAIIIAELHGPDAAIKELLQIPGMENNCHYQSTLGEMYLRKADKPNAQAHLKKALSLTTSSAERRLLEGKMQATH